MRLLTPIFLSTLFVLTACKNNNVKDENTTDVGTEIQKEQFVFTEDVTNFWIAYDKISAEKDTTKHAALLNEFFFDKGTKGLDLIMQARRYEKHEYVSMIQNYPLLWESIRKNTQLGNSLSADIDEGINRLKIIYPDLKPANVFFTVGVFRTGGTSMEGNVLIGAETAFGDKYSNVTEMPDSLGYIKKYWATKNEPAKNFALTNVHEYIHTQQNQDVNSNLLSIALLEGIAEFVSTLAMGLDVSPENAITYGKQNDARIKAAFENDMFHVNYGFWLWSEEENEFNTRDLAYYVGYAAAEKYYLKSDNKQAAIKEMIELDHFNNSEIEAFADKTGYFSKPVAEIKAENIKVKK